MAPIYTAKHVSGSDKPTPLFALKGLQNLIPTTLTSCGIQGVPLERQVAYTQYSQNIAHFIKASAVNTSVVIGAKALGYLETSKSLPLPAPPVHFTLQKEISFEQSEKLVRTLGTGASKNKVGNTTIYQSPSITIGTVAKLLPLASSHFNAGRDAVNPMGYKAFTFLSGALAELLQVHSYSAFQFESDDSLVEFRNLLYAPEAAYHPGKDVVDKRDEWLQSGSAHLSDLAERRFERDEMEHDGESEQVVSPFEETVKKALGMLVFQGRDTVAVARPPKHHVVNVGSSISIPDSSGILFPYFTGLTQPDPLMITSFVLKHLFPLLGSTVQECQSSYADLRRGFNSLATTDTGMAMSHLMFGLDLSIQVQGRCFAIIDSNRYMGFALLGARFAIFDSTKWIASSESTDLHDDLSLLDPHASAVRGLVSIFGELSTTGAYKGLPVTETTFGSPSGVLNLQAGLDLEKVGEIEKEIDRHLRSLNYMGDGYVQRNPQTVAEMLETILAETNLSLERPTYIPSIRAPLDSREFIGLSRFGPEAPSLWNERGQEFECIAREVPGTSGQKRKMGEPDVFANLPTRLIVTPKPLMIAVRDMVKVIERGAVRMDLKERAGKHRGMSVEAELMRKRIWEVLVNGLKGAQAKKRKVLVERKAASVPENFDDALSSLLG